MSLIVEDGSNVVGAESYQSVSDADVYHANRGNAAWAALSNPAKEQCLRRATEYMIGAYRFKWAGFRAHSDQSLDWPRAFVPRLDALGGYSTAPNYYKSDIVPDEVKRACADLALKASSSDLAPDIERLVSSETVGPIKIDYAEGAVPHTVYRAIDLMLKPFLQSSGGIKMVRA